MVIRELLDSAHREPDQSILADADPWTRQFVEQVEMHALIAARELPPDVSVSELQAGMARAILATYFDSGLDFESVLELFRQVAFEGTSASSAPVAWSDELNQRRFALIDKEIQGFLTPAERIELAALTRMMRDCIETETNLPIKGAKDLHRRLMHLPPKDRPD